MESAATHGQPQMESSSDTYYESYEQTPLSPSELPDQDGATAGVAD
jgi:hypothetical protein